MWIEILGLVAGILTTVAFVPQVLKTWRQKSADDLSLSMFGIFTTGILCWLIYGIAINNLPIILANTVTFILAGSILYFKLTFKKD